MVDWWGTNKDFKWGGKAHPEEKTETVDTCEEDEEEDDIEE